MHRRRGAPHNDPRHWRDDPHDDPHDDRHDDRHDDPRRRREPRQTFLGKLSNHAGPLVIASLVAALGISDWNGWVGDKLDGPKPDIDGKNPNSFWLAKKTHKTSGELGNKFEPWLNKSWTAAKENLWEVWESSKPEESAERPPTA